MTVMPVPVAPPDLPAAEPPAKPPAPGFDRTLRDSAARRRHGDTCTPERDSSAKADKPAKSDKAEKSDDRATHPPPRH